MTAALAAGLASAAAVADNPAIRACARTDFTRPAADCVTNSFQMRAGRSPPVPRGRVVVVADPHSHDDVVGEPDEPCVLVILARPGLALDRSVDPRRATRALANHAGENIVNCRARCWIACRLELRFLPREQGSIAVANGTDGVRLDAFRVGRDCRKR